MTNQEPKNNTSRFTITTKSLGIADTNVKGLAGFILNQKDITTAVMRTLLSVGIRTDAIKIIKAGCDQNKKLRIVIELFKKQLKNKKKTTDWFSFFDDDDDNCDNLLSKEFFKTLKNKVYYKHLNYKVLNKIIRIEFDAEIFIAFAYNLDYSDPYYRITCSPIKWLSNSELNKKYDRRSEIRKYISSKQSYIEDKLSRCIVTVTFAINKEKETAMYNKIVNTLSNNIPNLDRESMIKNYPLDNFYKDINNALSSGDFHPKQVLEFEGDYPENDNSDDNEKLFSNDKKKKKKKRKHNKY